MNTFVKKRIIDDTWNFNLANTKEFTHCYHNYPAMMIPQIARRLLHEFTPKNAKLLFDPYCGTGTSLVEANIIGLNNVGTDLNPLARLIAHAKNCLYDQRLIKEYINLFSDITFRSAFHGDDEDDSIKKPDFKNIDFWFTEYVIHKLSYIKEFINNQIPNEIRDFFLVAFSETIRESSLTRNNEFKLYRIPKEKIVNFCPDVNSIFLSKLNRNFKGLIEFSEVVKKTNSKIFSFNTCKEIPNNVFANDEIDIIVTSPPYGDSRTTVAYGQFSRLANQWLDNKNATDVDKILMGGSNHKDIKGFQIENGNDALTNIKSLDEKRYNEVVSFIIDYKESIYNISKYVKKNGIVCYVVGNRTVKSTQIPLDIMTAEFFTDNGFDHINTFIRQIPNKRMPIKNSPSNKVGELSPTMNNEYIVVMKKNRSN